MSILLSRYSVALEENMSNFKLNLPTDIPWERICVTQDMIDPTICDDRLPAKWQTSLAVFKYRPEDEYQMYPNYDITYLKVTATLTGYQPLDKEIQGSINWNGVNVNTIPGLTDLLNSYNPCHGAILQVVVGPEGKNQNTPLDKYPFFIDFEPKKRELYELATDTKEKQSRSIESLNITKSGGTTQSLEILDVDMGGGGFGMQSTYAGTGGGFNYTAPNGQWGTRRINAEESMSSRSSDVGQEKRETFSFSTQLSQMYHLLDSYHLGTNRVVFFIQPRPHTLEEPSGFVRGPRPVDGIQEFFMIVAQPKDKDKFCVSLRLDTSHLTKTPIMDYERKIDYSDSALANATLPTKQDTYVERKVRWKVSYGPFGDDDINYKHYTKKVISDVVFPVPDGYRIESYSDVINSHTGNGFSTVNLSPNGRTLTIHAEAISSIWFRDEGAGACIDNCPPDTLDEQPARVERKLQINLISIERNKQIGEEEALMITTRGLCCCSTDYERISMDEFVVGIKQIPAFLIPSKLYSDQLSPNYSTKRSQNPMFAIEAKRSPEEETCKECTGNSKQMINPFVDMKYTIRQANELSDFIKTETIKSLNDPNVKLQKFVDTEFFAKQLEYKLVQFKNGRDILNKSVAKELPKEILPKLEKYFKKRSRDISRQDMLSLRNDDFARIAGIKVENVQKIKLVSLGVKFRPERVNKKRQQTQRRKK